jgi:O-methyltransferase
VPGDFIETGVWRGGACILMRAVLTSYGVTDRNVWVADSFAGVPDEASYAPNDHFNEYSFHQYSELAVSRAAVTDNFRRYGLLDDQVRFLEGWFADTLAPAPIERIAVLRLDGDLYSSTWQALEALYPKVSAGGFIIIDDYGSVPSARLATLDYRRQHAIAEPIQAIDDDGAFWIKG